MKKILTLVVLVLMHSVSYAGGDAQAGEKLATTCLACHGETGNSLVSAFPNIAAQNEK